MGAHALKVVQRDVPLCSQPTPVPSRRSGLARVVLAEVLRPYRRARRPTALTAPSSGVLVPPGAAHVNLQQGLADMQVTLARLREAQEVDCVTSMQKTLAVQSEVDRITRRFAQAIAMNQELQKLQAAVAGTHELRAENAQVLGVPNTPELALPPSAHLDSTTELVGLECTSPVALPASLTSVGRQAPWSGAALAAPPWALILPASSSPVTSQAVTVDVRRAQLYALVVTTVSLVLKSRTLSADTARWAYAMLRLSLFRLWHSRARAHFVHSRWRASKKGRSRGRK